MVGMQPGTTPVGCITGSPRPLMPRSGTADHRLRDPPTWGAIGFAWELAPARQRYDETTQRIALDRLRHWLGSFQAPKDYRTSVNAFEDRTRHHVTRWSEVSTAAFATIWKRIRGGEGSGIPSRTTFLAAPTETGPDHAAGQYALDEGASGPKKRMCSTERGAPRDRLHLAGGRRPRWARRAPPTRRSAGGARWSRPRRCSRRNRAPCRW